MTGGPTAARLADGRRLHLQHGPIDLIIEAFGPADAVARAHDRATAAFEPILADLVAELPALRTAVTAGTQEPLGPVARRMVATCRPHAARWVTPMAAVAGAVADTVLAAMTADGSLDRAYVNNGGDIALHLAPGHSFDVGIVTRVDRPDIAATAFIEAAMPIRGVATSGFGGRSLTFGIADAVTVLAADGAAADVAATLIANAVSIDSPAIRRVPARELRDDTDLGDRPVTAAVGRLSPAEIAEALDAGASVAAEMLQLGLIGAAHLSLRGHRRIVGEPVPNASGRLAATGNVPRRGRTDDNDRRGWGRREWAPPKSAPW
jgi:hypothetical protein